MPRIKLKQVDQIWRKSVSDAQTSFIRHCQLKNLAPYTVKYYKENLQFFLDSMPQVKFVDEINQELIDQFVCMLMDKGNRVTAINPLLPEERNIRQDANGRWYNLEYAKPITIEDNCWLASNVVVCGGVTIGEGSVIGAGSVVTRNIPPHSLAVGNPCRVIRTLGEQDRMT